MKVKDLIIELSKLDPELDLIHQKDSEGNGYSPVGGCELVASAGDSVYSLNWTAADCCLDPEEWEQIKRQNLAVVIYPAY